ncbi:MAG TPA: VOC family protein [Candidatus Limnocylindria bacterium]|jgi:predicted enzyme related to lactoylglutathione lyase|nr:VOC family protein [Candidatus Limnocylindria bacterium]
MSDTAAATAVTAVTWFEIQVRNPQRARRFYETVLEAPLQEREMNGQRIVVFPYQRPGIGGSLEVGEPSAQGTVVYLYVHDSLDGALSRVAAAGGRVETGKTALAPGMGWFARIIDSEGNRVGLHAMS